jgi:hypothetical protein
VSGKLVSLRYDEHKPTKVVRLDLKLSESGDFVFWQNAIDQAAPVGKAPKWAVRQAPSFQIRLGVLERVDKPDRSGYVFRWPGGEERFVVRRDQHLTSKEVNMAFPEPPGLRPIGFKLDNGVEYLFQTAAGVRSELATAQAAAAEHPDSKGVARLFEGEAGSRLEIALVGPTSVFRTEIEINGRKVTLWANRKVDLPAK